ncbi:uncharacterized protein [Vicugna pacos]|uniref:Uncharacterized protein isoform X3 n=1 Tax=Vicugna pacos TaxID=30538 RepID=A0ABM5CDG4_VICPA
MWKTQKSLFSFSNDWGPGVFWKPVQVSACHGEQESQSTGASLTGTPNPTRRQQLSLHRGGRVQAGRPGTRPRRQLERQPPGLRAVRAAPVPWPYTPAAPKHSEESETQPVTATRSHQGDALLCVVPALGSAVSVEKARFLGGVACGRRGVSPRWARCSKVVTSGLSCCSPGLPACPSALSSEDLTPAAVCVQALGDILLQKVQNQQDSAQETEPRAGATGTDPARSQASSGSQVPAASGDATSVVSENNN